MVPQWACHFTEDIKQDKSLLRGAYNQGWEKSGGKGKAIQSILVGASVKLGPECQKHPNKWNVLRRNLKEERDASCM